jgi:hydroxyethylthiazole kinase-like uncharacterized protein yjeF
MTLEGLPSIRAAEVPVATAAQMAEIDRVAQEELGVSLEALMENASRQIAAATEALRSDLASRDVVAVAGAGNNGGDALGALRYLHLAGARVEAYLVTAREGLRPLARQQCDSLEQLGVPIHETTRSTDRDLVHRLERADVVVDGLLGYGARGAPRGEVLRMITVVVAGGYGRIVAVDIPSGLDPDTGTRLGDMKATPVRAALTVTLGLPKPGLVADAARSHVGELVAADIGIPAEAFARLGIEMRSLFARGSLVRVVF